MDEDNLLGFGGINGFNRRGGQGANLRPRPLATSGVNDTTGD